MELQREAERDAAQEAHAMQDSGTIEKGKAEAKGKGPDTVRGSNATRVSEYFSTEEVAEGSSNASALVRRDGLGRLPSGKRRVSIGMQHLLSSAWSINTDFGNRKGCPGTAPVFRWRVVD